jgi:hypothetical protein
MTNNAPKTYRVTVIERALAYYQVEAEDARAAAENWTDGEFEGRDDEALDTEGPSGVRERQPDGTWRKVPRPEWEVAPEIARFTDVEAERQRKAAPKLLAALEGMLEVFIDSDQLADFEDMETVKEARAAIAEAAAAAIPSEPAASSLLTALNAVLPYAENENRSLYECWKRDGDEAARQALDACERAIEQARTAIAEAKAAGTRTPHILPDGWQLLRHGPGSDYGPDAYTLWPYGAILNGIPEDAAAAIDATRDVLAALTWLLDDLSDAGQARNPESGETYDSVAFALAAKAKATTIPRILAASHIDAKEA